MNTIQQELIWLARATTGGGQFIVARTDHTTVAGGYGIGAWCIKTSEPDADAGATALQGSLSISSQPVLVEPPSAAGSVPRCQRDFGGSVNLTP